MPPAASRPTPLPAGRLLFDPAHGHARSRRASRWPCRISAAAGEGHGQEMHRAAGDTNVLRGFGHGSDFPIRVTVRLSWAARIGGEADARGQHGVVHAADAGPSPRISSTNRSMARAWPLSGSAVKMGRIALSRRPRCRPRVSWPASRRVRLPRPPAGCRSFEHGVGLRRAGAVDAGGADFEHVIHHHRAAIAEHLVQLLGIAEGAVAAHGYRGHFAGAVADNHAVVEHATSTAVTASGSAARNQLHRSVKWVISKSIGPCGALLLVEADELPTVPVVVDPHGHRGGAVARERAGGAPSRGRSATGRAAGASCARGKSGARRCMAGVHRRLCPTQKGMPPAWTTRGSRTSPAGRGLAAFRTYTGLPALARPGDQRQAQLLRGGDADRLHFRIVDGLA